MSSQPELVHRTRTPPVVLPNRRTYKNQSGVVAVHQHSVAMTQGHTTPRTAGSTAFLDVQGNPVHVVVTPLPAPTAAPVAPAEQPKVVLQGNVIQSMVQTELEEEGKIEFKGNLPTIPQSSQPRRPEGGASQPAAGITVQGDVAQCVVGIKVKSKGGISFGG